LIATKSSVPPSRPDWLEDRKKLRKDWYNYLKAGEDNLKTLLKDRDWTINYPNMHDYIALHEQSTIVLI
jgi:hypothetical protein